MAGDIYKKLAAIMAEIPAIGKDNRNAAQGFNFRSIDQVYNAIQPIMAKHGVFILPEVIAREENVYTTKGGTPGYRVVVTLNVHFCADDGSRVTSTVYGEGMDTADKAHNKALSGALKYSMFQTFLIPTASEDPDKDHPEQGKPQNSHTDRVEPPGSDDQGGSDGNVPPEDRKALLQALSGGVKRKLISPAQRDDALTKGTAINDAKRFKAYLGKVLKNLEKIASELVADEVDEPGQDDVPSRDSGEPEIF